MFADPVTNICIEFVELTKILQWENSIVAAVVKAAASKRLGESSGSVTPLLSVRRLFHWCCIKLGGLFQFNLT